MSPPNSRMLPLEGWGRPRSNSTVSGPSSLRRVGRYLRPTQSTVEDLPFRLITGLVDSDRFYDGGINFPEFGLLPNFPASCGRVRRLRNVLPSRETTIDLNLKRSTLLTERPIQRPLPKCCLSQVSIGSNFARVARGQPAVVIHVTHFPEAKFGRKVRKSRPSQSCQTSSAAGDRPRRRPRSHCQDRLHSAGRPPDLWLPPHNRPSCVAPDDRLLRLRHGRADLASQDLSRTTLKLERLSSRRALATRPLLACDPFSQASCPSLARASAQSGKAFRITRHTSSAWAGDPDWSSVRAVSSKISAFCAQLRSSLQI